MAADVFRESSVNNGVYYGVIDPRIERILWHLEDDSKKNVVDELVFDADPEEILEARDALFKEALKIHETQNGAGPQAVPPGKPLDTSYPKNTRTITIPWKMIKRRVPSIAANDLCELYLYRLDPEVGFPVKILKRKALNIAYDDSFNDVPPLDPIPEAVDEAKRPNPNGTPSAMPLFDNIDNAMNTPPDMGIADIFTMSNVSIHSNATSYTPQNGLNPRGPNAMTTPEPAVDIASDINEAHNHRDKSPPMGVWAPSVSSPVNSVDRGESNISTLNDISAVLSVREDSQSACVTSNDIAYSEPQVCALLSTRCETFIDTVSLNTSRSKGSPPKAYTTTDLVQKSNNCSNIADESRTKEGSKTHSRTPDDNAISNSLTSEAPVAKESQTDSNTQGSPPNTHPDTPSVPTPVRGNLPQSETFAYTDSRKASPASGRPPVPISVHSKALAHPPMQILSLPTRDQLPRIAPSANPTHSTAHSTVEQAANQPPVKIGNSTTKNPDLSQDSFLREIEEIHQKALSSTPRSPSPTSADKGTTTVSEMATQTAPNEIYDPPVKKSEFSSQMGYVDRALTNHERRMRANEVWCEREEEKVNKIDAELYTIVSELRLAHEALAEDRCSLRIAHEALTEDHNSLKKVVSDIMMVSPNFEMLVERNNIPTPAIHEEVQGPNYVNFPRYQRIPPVIHLDETLMSDQCIPQPTVDRGKSTDLMPNLESRQVMQNALSNCTSGYAPPPIPNVAPAPCSIRENVSEPPVPLKPTPPKPAPNPKGNQRGQPTQSKNQLNPLPKGANEQRAKCTTVNVKDLPTQIPQNENIRESKANEKKRQESPADSFLKEAKRVFTPTVTKRHSGSGVKPMSTDTANPRRLTSTPGASQATTQSITLSNMYAVLESQDVDTPQHITPQRPGHNKAQDAVNLSSPVDFPPLPRRERPEITRNMKSQGIPELSNPNNRNDESWADIDEEDDKTINAFLASVDGGNIGCKEPVNPDTNANLADNVTHTPNVSVPAHPYESMVPGNISPMNLILNTLSSGSDQQPNRPQYGGKGAPPAQTMPIVPMSRVTSGLSDNRAQQITTTAQVHSRNAKVMSKPTPAGGPMGKGASGLDLRLPHPQEFRNGPMPGANKGAIPKTFQRHIEPHSTAGGATNAANVPQPSVPYDPSVPVSGQGQPEPRGAIGGAATAAHPSVTTNHHAPAYDQRQPDPHGAIGCAADPLQSTAIIDSHTTKYRQRQNSPPRTNSNSMSRKDPHAPRQGQRPNSQSNTNYNGMPSTGRVRSNESCANPDPPREHPDRVVNKNGWTTKSKKRKRTRSSPKTQSVISGGQTKPYRDVFVRNLETDNYVGPEDMADAVQDYCEERGVGVYFIKVMNSLYEGYANIKLTVATCDYTTALDNDFWPDNVSPREWYIKDKKTVNDEWDA